MNNSVIHCRACGAKTEITALDSWGVLLNGNVFEELYCPKCAPEQPKSKGLVILGSGSMFALDEPPLNANFTPIKTGSEIKRLRSDGTDINFWATLENTYREVFAGMKDEISSAPFPNREFKELEVHFSWNQGKVDTLTFTGDRPKLGQWLNIYQQARLEKMGLTESNGLNTDWSIEISDRESSPDNLVRIISHVLQFGYLLQPHLQVVES